MTKSEIISYWRYFCALSDQLVKTTQYVDHSTDSEGNTINGSTYSYEFFKILMLASSEFEVVGKSLCKEAGVKLRNNANIVKLTETILNYYPNIINTEVITNYKTIYPLKNWTTGKNEKGDDIVIGIPWWDAYNNTKHHRFEQFKDANLDNCIAALSSLMVLELYLSQVALGSLDDLDTAACSYFENVYGTFLIGSQSSSKLPDFK